MQGFRWGRLVIIVVGLLLVTAECSARLVSRTVEDVAKEGGAKVSAIQTEIARAPTQAPRPTGAPATKVVVAPTAAPGQPTVMPATPLSPQAAATKAACDAHQEVKVGGSFPYPPYHTWQLAAIMSACGNKVKISVISLSEEEQRYWLEGRDQAPGQGELRLLVTTHNSCVLSKECEEIDGIGESNGADAIVVRPQVVNWDDAWNVEVVTGVVGGVSEYFAKASPWACGYRDIGGVKPLLDVGPALDFWVKNPAYRVYVGYEPNVADALQKVPGSRILMSSKLFVGIHDIVASNVKNSRSEVILRALLANLEAFNFVMEKPREAWQVLYDWAGSDPDRQEILGYTDFDSWWTDMSREAMFTGEQKVFLFGSGKTNILVQRMREAQQVFTKYPTFRRNDPVPYAVPVRDPSALVNDWFINQMKADPRMQKKVTPPNVNVNLSAFAPPGTGSKVLSEFPQFNVNALFREGTAEFKDPAAARSELGLRVTNCLRLFKVTLEIQTGSEVVSRTMGDRLNQELVRGQGVPQNKIMVSQKSGIPAGQIRIAILGSEE